MATITKTQLLEIVRKAVDFQERKKLLENKISTINEELLVLTEDKDITDKKIDQSELAFLEKLYKRTPTEKVKKMIDDLKKKDIDDTKYKGDEFDNESDMIANRKKDSKKKKDIDEGLFQNIGKAVSGVKNIGQNMVKNYQAGTDQQKLQYLKNDIAKKQQELNDLNKQYKYLTTQTYSNKGAQTSTAVPRNQQGVIPQKQKVQAPPVQQKTQVPVQNKQATGKFIKPVQKRQVPTPQRRAVAENKKN